MNLFSLIDKSLARISHVSDPNFVSIHSAVGLDNIFLLIQWARMSYGLNGERRIPAHVGIDSHHRVGKYGVDTRGLEAFLAALELLNSDVELIVIDEIGKMEFFFKPFSESCPLCFELR